MNNKLIPLIDKIIELTNSKAIEWNIYSKSDIVITPRSKNFFSQSIALVATAPLRASWSTDKSFIAKYQHGYIALLAYEGSLVSNSYVELVLQPNKDSPSKLLATSDSPTDDIASKIKRLYNLVDCSIETDENINQFIDDILNG